MEVVLIAIFFGPLAVKIAKTRQSAKEDVVIFAYTNLFYVIALSVFAGFVRPIFGDALTFSLYGISLLLVQYKMLIEAIGVRK